MGLVHEWVCDVCGKREQTNSPWLDKPRKWLSISENRRGSRAAASFCSKYCLAEYVLRT